MMRVISKINRLVSSSWKLSEEICRITDSNYFLSRIYYFADVFFFVIRFRSNSYLDVKYYNKSNKRSLKNALNENALFQKEQKRIRKITNKYRNVKYEHPKYWTERNLAYIKLFNMGEGCIIQTNVELWREHSCRGTIKIGKNVLLAKNCFIDYSGFVEIKDNVQLKNGVVIESHHHPFHSNPNLSRDITIQTSLTIEEGAVIGTRAIILSTCSIIGKHARVGAGAVVTKDVPDYAVVVGVPARVIKYQNKL